VNDTGMRRARVSGGEIAFLEMGDPDDPAVLLLHGFPGSSYAWRRFAPLLSPWMHVIAPDLLGCGDSDQPVDADLSVLAQAGYARELLDHLAIERFAVVGHAHGGGIAQLLALDRGVETMILLDPIAFDAWPSETFGELQRSAPEAPSASLVRAVISTGFDLGMGHRPRLTEADLDEYCRPFSGDGGPAAFVRFVRAMDGEGLAESEPALRALEVPALLLWGEDDPFIPVTVAERLADALPMSSLAVLPGCSHFLMEDAPETIAPLMFEYLRAVYLRAGHVHEEPGPITIELGRRPPGEEVGG
jgi:pimeloyl-ACP methyl ester carboxylesterase